MNRRRFLELLGTAAVGTTIAYSFPSIIVPRNIAMESMWVYPTQFVVPMKSYNLMPHGLIYIIDNGSRRIIQGRDRDIFKIVTLP